MSCRHPLAYQLGWLLAPVLGSCTVVSGWSDLQSDREDVREGDDEIPTGRDGGRDGARGDGASTAHDSDAEDPCAPTVCSGERSCCVQPTGRSCSTRAECRSSAGLFLRCEATAECASGTTCCLVLGELTAECAATCETGNYPLCDPNGGDCSGTCAPFGFPGVFRCR